MPSKRRNIGRRTNESKRKRTERQIETGEETAQQIFRSRSETEVEMVEQIFRSGSDAPESSDQRQGQNEVSRLRISGLGQTLTHSSRNRNNNRESIQMNRSNVLLTLHRIAFRYNPEISYSLHPVVIVGSMDNVCTHCNALKFKYEAPGMCCSNGKVKLPPLNPPPEPLSSLVAGTTSQSKHFLNNIRNYNSSFQMTSFGATNIITENYLPTFKIQGQIYHSAGSLLPYTDDTHKFLQIYFIGNSNDEVNKRCEINKANKREIVELLQQFFHDHNQLIKLFKTAIELMPSDDHKIVIRADKTPVGEHARRFNAPTIDEVAIVIEGDQFESRDIVLRRRNNRLQRVADTHRSYDALQYPILFWQGEDGYHFNLKLINPANGEETSKKVSAMHYYAYRLMIRTNEENHILKCRQLFHQYVVDMFAKIESERLLYIRLNQKKLRSEEYIHLRDAIINDRNVSDIGKMTILPATYTGSPRHMQQYAQDAISYVRQYGRPDLFITFTSNPKWTEIQEHLLPGQSTKDRHDITARVFKQKLKSLMDFIVKHHVFGETRSWMYSIEWQKRGLPHAHILIWLINKITPDEIDKVISAEIPDSTVDPELFEVVKKNMIHGPCGVYNMRSPCMADKKCTKRYPRALLSETITGNDGYPQYRRRSTHENGKSIILKIRNQEIEVDNRWVVPYSPLLSKAFKAHINVEYCNSVKSIKYICKYVNKGSDMAVFGVSNENGSNDEIKQYQLGRYISSNEAVWRILSFPIHDRHPTVVHLAVHLENGQRVFFTTENVLERAATPPSTTLTAFFSLCRTDTFAKTLLYSDIPTYFTWNTSRKEFQRRKKGKKVEGQENLFSTDALGRLYTVHPNQAECYYLRLLLVNVRGPTSFQNLRTVDGCLCETYREACQRLNLLENDAQWDSSLADAAFSAHPHQIRALFAIILSTCAPSNPNELWEKYKDFMTEDILHRHRIRYLNHDVQYTPEMYNEALILIEDNCLLIINKALSQLGIKSPDRLANDLFHTELQREKNFDINDLNLFVESNIQKLLPEQKHVYETMMRLANDENDGIYFLDAPGGTGKTFLISMLLATIRAQNNIALAIASSGIAATLLDGCRTAHSALKLSLNIQNSEKPICNISKTSGMCKVLQQCKIIIWDECTMAHKKSLEALDRTLQDLRDSKQPFGGALILLAGDFRQTLPVIPRSTQADELDACLKSSHLWRHVKKFSLTTNMRVILQNDPSAKNFEKQLLDIGNGKIKIEETTGCIKLPDDFYNKAHSQQELIQCVFPHINQNHKNPQWLSERAILAAKNIDVNSINISIQDMLPGEMTTYKSIDTVIDQDEAINFPTEFLNSLDLSGLPPHIINLKIGVPIILLRNIDPPRLCNGTRLVVKALLKNIIEATILIGKFKGETVFIPRIPMTPTEMPFQFKRLQFPIKLAFAISINKSQGQSLRVCGLNLENPCFSHGQLYVACSRVGNPRNLFIFMPNGVTKNVVYSKALQ